MLAPLRVACAGMIFVLLALLALLASEREVMAHAALIAGSPADGSVVASAPAQFTLDFSEPVSPLVLKLIQPDGTARVLDSFTLKDRRLVIDAPTRLDGGTYVLSWRVVSEDGHPVGGTIVFSVGAPSRTLPNAPAQTDPAARALLWTTKVGLYLALFFGIGGAAFPAWVAPLPRAGRRFSLILVTAGLAILPAAVTAQGLDALGAPFGDLLQPAIWRAGISSPFGRTVLIAAAALAVALISLAMRGTAGRVWALLALAGTGFALAASGHASAAEPQVLMRPAVFLHAVGIAAWTGALFPLSAAMLDPTGPAALDTFSRRILTVVAVILLSGLVLAVVQVQRTEAMTMTAYGRVLLLKMVWVPALLALAGLNRYWLTKKVQASKASSVASLRRLIAGELVFVLLIFGTAALWRFTPPPRSLLMAAAQPAYVHIHTEKAMAEVTFTPGRVGSVAVSVSLLNSDFGPLPARELRIGLSNPEAGIEPIARQAVRAADDTWRVKEFPTPAAARWTVELEVLVSDFEMVRLTGTVQISP